jgi:fatty-acyl-CoA synthase
VVTVPGTLRATARRIPDTEALKFGTRIYTYRELDYAVDQAVRVLRELGLARGERIALMAPSSDVYVITFYAALRLGAVVVPVNPTLAAPELEHILGDADVRLLAYDFSARAVVEVVSAQFGATAPALLSLSSATGDAELLALIDRVDPAAELECAVEESDNALILYTSGTTGKPKGALFDHHRTVWVAVACISSCGLRMGDRLLHVAPLYHAAQLCTMLVPGVMVGATHIVHSGFDADAVSTALEAEKITLFFGVPTMYQLLLRHPSLRGGDFSHWRTAMFGAAPMPASTVAQIQDVLPGVELMQLCGQTEAGPGGIYSTHKQVTARPDASGRQALPLTEARVVNEGGTDVGPGEVGELILRGETVMKGYWSKPDETAAVLRDGWLHTGDLVRVDVDGYFTLVDRLKDMVISGGRNVYSVEVENAVSGHPDVIDCAVVGRPHPVYGESIVALITLRPGTTAAAAGIQDFCRTEIAPYKVPHEVVFGPVPRNLSGKALKNDIRLALARPPSDSDLGGLSK